jgi:hypothetical protein
MSTGTNSLNQNMAFSVESLTLGGTAVTATAAELNASVAGLLATTAEINRVADASTRVVNLAVTTPITELAHDMKLIVMGGAGGARTFTLPAATGSGVRFRFIVGAVNTSGHLIKSVAGADVMGGTIFTRSDDAAAVLAYKAGSTDDTITLNGTTTGGVSIGDWVELCDIATNRWAVTGLTTSSGSEATPFSDTVA